jgi:uncharacterized protein (TIGR02266 family)
MMDEFSGFGGPSSENDDLIEIDLNFESMRRFQAEFSPNLSKDGLFIDTGEPLSPSSVVRFRVILPEDFVFLEGTAVVEWHRSAEAMSDGPPGMALRFVTLSPQNQELVEQLVQDHIDADGTPFDLDVRPEFADFPTDALEGVAPEQRKVLNEGYRLTVRGAGSSLEAEALQALVDAAPDGNDPVAAFGDDSAPVEEEIEIEAETADDPDPADVPDPIDEPRGFEIVSESPEIKTEEPVETTVEDVTEESAEESSEGSVEEPSNVAEPSDPPELDWSAEAEAPMESVQEPPAEFALVEEEEPASEDVAIAEDPSPEIDDFDSSVTDVLQVPEEFATGPEVIEDVEEDFGSPAFDVSLPENDDEPDTTPVLPDEGRDDVHVTTEDGLEEEPKRRRRLWPLGLAAVLVLAVAAGFLSPYVKTWLERRGGESPVAAAAVTTDHEVSQPENMPIPEPETGATEDPVVPGDETPANDTIVDKDDEARAMTEQNAPEPAVEALAPERVADAVPTTKADAIESIEIEAGSTGTIVRIRGNGTLEEGVVSMENLSSPPRVLVRLRGIRSVYRPFTIESATAEVTRARIGHHKDRRPPELWVVLDLTGPQAEIGGIDIQGDRVEFMISGP